MNVQTVFCELRSHGRQESAIAEKLSRENLSRVVISVINHPLLKTDGFLEYFGQIQDSAREGYVGLVAARVEFVLSAADDAHQMTGDRALMRRGLAEAEVRLDATGVKRVGLVKKRFTFHASLQTL